MNSSTDKGEKIPRELNAFCEFIEANYRVIYTVALAHVRDADVAQEISQDVCVRLLLERDKLPRLLNPGGWLARVSRNTAIDWIRQRQTHSRILAMMESWNHNQLAASGNVGSAGRDARDAAINGEEKTRLYTALEGIAPEDREMLLLHFMDGLDKKEIGRILEVHPSTVGRRIDRSLGDMKKSLKDMDVAKLAKLRPAEHTGRSVVATLTAVAALSAVEKTMLAGIAAPLPVLSAGAGISGGAGLGGSVSGGMASAAKDAVSGWIVPVLMSVAVFSAIVIFADRLPFFKSDSASGDSVNVTAISDGSNADRITMNRIRGVSAKRRGIVGTSMQKGLTSTNVSLPGYLKPGVMDGKTLNGTVVNEDGDSIAGAEVVFWTEETSWTQTSNSDGGFTFKDLPSYRQNGMLHEAWVTATADGYAHATVGEYDLYLPLPTVSFDMRIVMAKPVTMSGVVVDEGGAPVAGANVAVITEFDKSTVAYQDNQYDQDIFATESDAEGRFKFTHLKPGYVALNVKHPDFAPELSEVIASDSKAVRMEVSEGVTIKGTVFDGETTVPNAVVNVHGILVASGAPPSRNTVTTDEHGEFIARHIPVPKVDFTGGLRVTVPQIGIPHWNYQIVVNDSKIPIYNVTLYRGETTRVLNMNSNDPRASSGGRRSVSLADVTPLPIRSWPNGGSSLEGWIVPMEGLSSDTVVRLRVRGDNGLQRSLVSRDGKFEMRNLQEGKYTVWGSVDRSSSDLEYPYLLVGPVSVELRKGELQTVSLSCNNSGVEGYVEGLGKDKSVSMEIGASDSTSLLYGQRCTVLQVKDKEPFKLMGLPPGKYYAAIFDGSIRKHVLFTVEKDKVTHCIIPVEKPVKIYGYVIDSSTSEPVTDANIVLLSAGVFLTEKWNDAPDHVKTDSRGRFEAELTTGSYAATVYTEGDGIRKRQLFEVSDGRNRIPDIDVNQQVAGFRIQNLNHASEGFQWSRVTVDIIDLETGVKIDAPYVTDIIDNSTVFVKNVPCGSYAMMVYCYQDARMKMDKSFASIFIPRVDLTKPDFYQIINLQLDEGLPVNLNVIGKELVTSGRPPQFWLEDSFGVRGQLHVPSRTLELRLGLAAGSYKFGVTLSDGTDQSVDFAVAPGSDGTVAELRLK